MTRLKRKKIPTEGYCHNKQGKYTYTSFFKRERQYDAFKAKENANRGILPQQTRQIYMYTSFFKRERQYDAFKAIENINRWLLPKQTTPIEIYIPRS